MSQTYNRPLFRSFNKKGGLVSVLRFTLLSVIFLSSTLWASVGKVALLKGEAVAERNAQTIALQNGSLIEDKDAIKTGKEAQIQLLFEDKTVIITPENAPLRQLPAFQDFLNFIQHV